MRNILIINNGIIVDIVQQEAEWDNKTYNKQPFDTACDDPSGRFLIGEEYTTEKFLSYNTQVLPYDNLTENTTVVTQASQEITRSDTGDIVKLSIKI